MEATIKKLQKLQLSVEKLETVLQEIWSCIDELGEDDEFRKLMDQAEQYKSQRKIPDESTEDLCFKINELDTYMGQIPESGTSAVYFEQSISELIDWINENK